MTRILILQLSLSLVVSAIRLKRLEAEDARSNSCKRPGRSVHIGFIDPAKATGNDSQVMAVFRQVRDAIKVRFAEFYAKEIKYGV